MCKSKYNPVNFMLAEYKSQFKSYAEYKNSFLVHDEKSEYKKLMAFCKSLSEIMKINNITYSIKENTNKIDLFYRNTLLITYEIDLFKTLKTESSLKFQFLIEWGILLNLNNKKQLLIAL